MMLHFVYAGQPDDQRSSSPYCITRNLYNYLKERTPVTYHDWCSTYSIDLQPDDVLIGHPHYDPNTIIQRAFRENRSCKARCLIHPFHHRRPEDNWPFDPLARAADCIFSICGPYWYDTIGETVFSHWKDKMVRLDMAVDAAEWVYRKVSFNEPGKRGIVFVGSGMPQKNIPLLCEIVSKMPDVKFEWYGASGDYPFLVNKNTYAEGWGAFDGTKVARICSQNDLFVNTSISDANPTTLLEFCLASGIIPLCTETSGYWRDECFINIPLDADGAVVKIREWLNKPSSELQERSLANRKICEERYTWDRFCSTVWQRLSQYL